jgi:stage II sporulation protein D
MAPGGAAVEGVGPVRLTASGRELERLLHGLEESRVRGLGPGLALGGRSLRQHAEVAVEPETGGEVRVDGVAFPGAAAFLREEDGDSVTVAAVLDLEEYVSAALASRADWRSWSDECLAAHAVVLRTQALFRTLAARERAGASGAAPRIDLEDRSLVGTFRSGGMASAKVARAVNVTRGLVLAWDRRIFPACMTEYCAGHTEDACPVLAGASITPLSGVECPHCRLMEHPRATWSVKLTREALAERLRPRVRAEGVELPGKVASVRPSGRGPAGPRVTRLAVETAYGSFDVDVQTFRECVGEDVCPSSWFEVETVGPETLVVRGRGVGHGSGLCQYGAEAMARSGASFGAILSWYFPGAELSRLPYRPAR